MRLYRRAVAYFLPDWALIAALVGLIAISVCVALLEAWPIAILIDSVLTAVPKGDRFHQLFLSYLPESRPGQILGLVLVGMVLQIVGYTVWMGRMVINAELNVRGTARVRFDLFAKLQGLGLAYHRSHQQGHATFRLITDVNGPWGIMELVTGTAVAAVTLCAMTAILLAQSETLALAAFAVAPFLIASNWFFARRIHHRSLDSKQADADLTSFVQRAIGTVGLAQAFRREDHEFGRFRCSVDGRNTAFMRLTWQEQLYPLARDIILAVSAAIIFGYGGYLVYRDQFATALAPGATVAAKGMTVGALLVFIDYTRKLWDPLKWLTEFVAKAQFHVAASQRVFEVLDTPDDVREAPNPVRLPVQRRALVLDRVGFGYGTETILHDVSAQIRPGELVAFVGPSGAGKSTLLSLILRFYDPTSGAVRLDATDLRQLSLADLRAHMALVGQDNAMLPLSVAENIAYGRPDATRREIAEAAALAGAAEFVAGLPAGYDTMVAEGGQNLSGGQRQRIAIARALLTDAPLLILDEPTSALDPIHERHLVDTIRGLKGHRTIVMVTHRLESVVDCDQVFVMEAGRIVERGTHAALLAKGGRYARMWRGVAADAPTARQAVSNGRRRTGLLRDGTE